MKLFFGKDERILKDSRFNFYIFYSPYQKRFILEYESIIIDTSESIVLKTTSENVFPRLQNGLISVGHKIVTGIPNQTLVSEGKRDFSTTLMVVLILFCWPAAIGYYFRSKRSSLTIILVNQNPTGCKITITSNGKYGNAIRNSMFDKLQEEYESSKSELN